MGPLCTLGQLKNIQAEVEYAEQEGAKILTGGKQPEGKEGLFYEPTIIECPNQDLRIVDTELFGPVLCVQRFKTEEEVLSLANDTEHGLAAGVFTKIQRALCEWPGLLELVLCGSILTELFLL